MGHTTMGHDAYTGIRIIGIGELRDRLGGVARSTIYAWVAAGLLPRPVRLGQGRIGWPVQEIDDLLRARMAERGVG